MNQGCWVEEEVEDLSEAKALKDELAEFKKLTRLRLRLRNTSYYYINRMMARVQGKVGDILHK